MTLSCNCDMPIEIYCDWLQDQGWDCDELRAEEDVVGYWSDYHPYEDLLYGFPFFNYAHENRGCSYRYYLTGGEGYWGGDGRDCDRGDGSIN